MIKLTKIISEIRTMGNITHKKVFRLWLEKKDVNITKISNLISKHDNKLPEIVIEKLDAKKRINNFNQKQLNLIFQDLLKIN